MSSGIVSKTESFGQIYGKLFKEKVLPETLIKGNADNHKTFGDDQITALSTLLTPEDTANAIAAELGILTVEMADVLVQPFHTLNSDEYVAISNSIRYMHNTDKKDSKLIEAIDSGIFKIKSHYGKEVHKIITAIRDNKNIDKFLRTGFGSLWAHDYKFSDSNNQVLEMINKLSFLFLILVVMIRSLDKCLRLASQEYVEKKRRNGIFSKQALDKIDRLINEELGTADEIARGTSLQRPRNLKHILSDMHKENITDDTWTTIVDTFNELIDDSRITLDDAQFLLGDYGNTHGILNCDYVLCVESVSHELFSQVLKYIDGVLSKTNEFLTTAEERDRKLFRVVIPNTYTSFSGGRFIAFGGTEAYTSVLKVIDVIISKHRYDNKRIILLSKLDAVSQIKVKQNDTGGEIKYGYFQQRFATVYSKIKVDIMKPNSFVEISFDGKALADSKEYDENIFQVKGKKDIIIRASFPAEERYRYSHYVKSEMIYDPKDVSVGIITAIEKECTAMRNALDNVETITFPGTGAGRRFYIGTVPSASGTTNVIALSVSGKGTNRAATRATDLIHRFPNVKSIIMTGIAGGVPCPDKPEDHVRLGDIVVSDERGITQYDMVKLEIDETIHRSPPRPTSADMSEAVRYTRMESADITRRKLNERIKALLKKEKITKPSQKDDILIENEEIIPHPKNRGRNGSPVIFCGPIASANTLLKKPSIRDSLRDKFGTKAVEMEGSGIADATWDKEKGYIVIRGICDYCNMDKGDIWQKYAAIVAASFTRIVLEQL